MAEIIIDLMLRPEYLLFRPFGSLGRPARVAF